MTEIQTTLGALLPAIGTQEQPGPLVRLTSVRLPAKVAYDVLKLCKLATERVQEFQELRNGLVRELGDGGDAVLPENHAAFFTRVQELAAVEVTIPWKPLELEALASVDVSADELNALGALLVEE